MQNYLSIIKHKFFEVIIHIQLNIPQIPLITYIIIIFYHIQIFSIFIESINNYSYSGGSNIYHYIGNTCSNEMQYCILSIFSKMNLNNLISYICNNLVQTQLMTYLITNTLHIILFIILIFTLEFIKHNKIVKGIIIYGLSLYQQLFNYIFFIPIFDYYIRYIFKLENTLNIFNYISVCIGIVYMASYSFYIADLTIIKKFNPEYMLDDRLSSFKYQKIFIIIIMIILKNILLNMNIYVHSIGMITVFGILQFLLYYRDINYTIKKVSIIYGCSNLCLISTSLTIILMILFQIDLELNSDIMLIIINFLSCIIFYQIYQKRLQKIIFIKDFNSYSISFLDFSMQTIYDYVTCENCSSNERIKRSLFIAVFIRNHYLNCNEIYCPCKKSKYYIIAIDSSKIPIHKLLLQTPMMVTYKQLILEIINQNLARYINKNKRSSCIKLRVIQCLFIFHQMKSVVKSYIKLSTLKKCNYKMNINEKFLVSDLEQALNQEFIESRLAEGLKLDLMKAINFYQKYEDLKKNFREGATKYLSFFMELKKSEVDIDKIIKLADEIIYYRQILAKICQYLLTIHAESEELLVLLQNISKMNLFEMSMASEINKIIKKGLSHINAIDKSHKRDENMHAIQIQHLFDQYCGVIFLSIDEGKLGNIENISPNLLTLLGFDKAEIHDCSINLLMPAVYSERHDEYLIKFMDGFKITQTKIALNTIFINDKRGFLYPAKSNIRMELLSNKLSIAGLVRININEDIWNLATNKCGEIIGYDPFFYRNIINKITKLNNDIKILHGLNLCLFIPRVFGNFMCTFNPNLKSFFGSEFDFDEESSSLKYNNSKILLSQMVYIIMPKSADILQFIKLKYKEHNITYSTLFDSNGRLLASIASSIYNLYEVSNVLIYKIHLTYKMSSYQDPKLFVGACEFSKCQLIRNRSECIKILDNCKKFISNSYRLWKVLRKKHQSSTWKKANIPEVQSEVLQEENNDNKPNNIPKSDRINGEFIGDTIIPGLNIKTEQNEDKGQYTGNNTPAAKSEISDSERLKGQYHFSFLDIESKNRFKFEGDMKASIYQNDFTTKSINRDMELFSHEAFNICENEEPDINCKLEDLNKISYPTQSPFAHTPRNNEIFKQDNNNFIKLNEINDTDNFNSKSFLLQDKKSANFSRRKNLKISFDLSDLFPKDYKYHKENLRKAKIPDYIDTINKTLFSLDEDEQNKMFDEIPYTMLVSNFNKNRSYIYDEIIKVHDYESELKPKFTGTQGHELNPKSEYITKKKALNAHQVYIQDRSISSLNGIESTYNNTTSNKNNKIEASILKSLQKLLSNKKPPAILQKLNIAGYISISIMLIIIIVLCVDIINIINFYKYFVNMADFSSCLTFSLSMFYKDMQKSNMIIDNLWYYGIQNLNQMQYSTNNTLYQAYLMYYDSLRLKALNKDLQKFSNGVRYENYQIGIIEDYNNENYTITLGFIESLTHALSYLHQMNNDNLTTMAYNTDAKDFFNKNYQHYFEVLNTFTNNFFDNLHDNPRTINIKDITLISLVISISIAFLFLSFLLVIYKRLESKRIEGLSLITTIDSNELESRIKYIYNIQALFGKKYDLTGKSLITTPLTRIEDETLGYISNLKKSKNILGDKSKRRSFKEWKKKRTSSLFILGILLGILGIIIAYFVAFSEVIKSKNTNFLELTTRYEIMLDIWFYLPAAYAITYRMINLYNDTITTPTTTTTITTNNNNNTDSLASIIQNVYHTYDYINGNIDIKRDEVSYFQESLPIYMANSDISSVYKSKTLELYTQNVCSFISDLNQNDLETCKNLLQGNMNLGFSGIYNKILSILNRYVEIVVESIPYNSTIALSIVNTSIFEELDLVLNYVNIAINQYLTLFNHELLWNLNKQATLSYVYLSLGGMMVIIFLILIWIPFIKKLKKEFWKVKEIYGVIPIDMLMNNMHVKKYLKNNTPK